MGLVKNKIYRCRITGYSSDGSGVAKIEGHTVFVPGTANGGQCSVKIVKVGKSCASAGSKNCISLRNNALSLDLSKITLDK